MIEITGLAIAGVAALGAIVRAYYSATAAAFVAPFFIACYGKR